MKIAAALVLMCGILLAPELGQAEVIGGPEKVMIPHIEFVETPMTDAVNFLEQRCMEIDPVEGGPNAVGFNVVLVGDFSDTTITMMLKNVPAEVALRTLAELADANLENRGEYWTISRGRVESVVLGLKGSEALQMKLNSIRIPSVEFVNTPLLDAIGFLRVRSEELDVESPAGRKGVNIVFKKAIPETVSLLLKNVSMATALEATALVSGYRMEIREHLVMLKVRE